MAGVRSDFIARVYSIVDSGTIRKVIVIAADPRLVLGIATAGEEG
jgi:hypothetical protein